MSCFSNPLYHRTATPWQLFAGSLGLWMIAASAATAGATEAIILVPDGATVVTITEADLLAALPAGSGPVLQTSPTGRGTLINPTGGFEYYPTSDFFDQGSDSFHFLAAETGGESTWHTAYLIAGMAGDGEMSESFEGPDPLAAFEQNDPTFLALNDVDPLSGLYDLLFDLGPSQAPFISPKKPGNGCRGGYSGGGIDPGGNSPPSSSRLVFAAAYGDDPEAELLAQVALVEDSGALHLAAEMPTSGVTESSNLAPLAGAQSWGLQWWPSTTVGSRDGGALLTLDGRIAAELTGIDNPDAAVYSWAFGSLANDGFTGPFHLDNLFHEGGLRVPRFPPLHADNFEGVQVGWSANVCGPMLESTAGRLNIPLDPATPDCFLEHTGKNLRYLRARFEVDLDAAAMAPGSRLALLRGVDSTNGVPHTAVRLREQAGKIQVRADTDRDDGTRITTPWTDLPAGGLVSLEILWWASKAPSTNGGLHLLLDGQLIGELATLANASRRIDQVRLGAMGIDPGTTGTISFETYESWR